MEYTLNNIIEIVDQTKDKSHEEQMVVAYEMPIYACALYVLHMEKRHGKKVLI